MRRTPPLSRGSTAGAGSPAGFARKESFVIDDYSPVWKPPAFAADVRACGESAACALRRRLREEGHDPRALWARMRRTIRGLLSAARPSGEAALRRHGVRAGATFELLRFDFMVDRRGTPLLTEVNISPNLIGKTHQDSAVKQRLLTAVLSVATLRLRPHPPPTPQQPR